MQDQATLNVGLSVGGSGDVPVPYAFQDLLQQMGASDTPPDPRQPLPGQSSPAQAFVPSEAASEVPSPLATANWYGEQNLPRSVQPSPRLDVSSAATSGQTSGPSPTAISNLTLSRCPPTTQTAIPQSQATQTTTTQTATTQTSVSAALTPSSNENSASEKIPPQAANAATSPPSASPSANSTAPSTLRTPSDGRPSARPPHTVRSAALAQDALPTPVTTLLGDSNQLQVALSSSGPSTLTALPAEIVATPALSTTDQQSNTTTTPTTFTSFPATGNATTFDGGNDVVPAPLPPAASLGNLAQPSKIPAFPADLTNDPTPAPPQPAASSNTDGGHQLSPAPHPAGTPTRAINSASVPVVTTAAATTSTDGGVSGTLPTVQQPPRIQPTEAPKPLSSPAAAKNQSVTSASAVRTSTENQSSLAVTATPITQAPTQEQRPATSNFAFFGPSVSAIAPHTGVAQGVGSIKTQPPVDAPSATTEPDTAAGASAAAAPSVGPVSANAGHNAAPAIAPTVNHSSAEVATSAPVLLSERSGPPLASTGSSREANAPRAEVPDPPSPTLTHARLMQTMGGSQMQVNLSTEEFGRVSVRAGYSRDALTAQITLDNAQLGTAISAHLPGAEQKLAGDHGLRTAITVNTSTANQDLGGGQSGSNHRQGNAPNSAKSGPFSRSPLTGADPDRSSASTSTPTPATSGRLNIRI